MRDTRTCIAVSEEMSRCDVYVAVVQGVPDGSIRVPTTVLRTFYGQMSFGKKNIMKVIENPVLLWAPKDTHTRRKEND
jgi:hypothetical protein